MRLVRADTVCAVSIPGGGTMWTGPGSDTERICHRCGHRETEHPFALVEYYHPANPSQTRPPVVVDTQGVRP